MNVRMRNIFLAVLSLLIASCSILSPVKTAPVSIYTLSATGGSAAVHSRAGRPVLMVSAPTAAPGYQTSNMLYTKRPFELNNFARNRWAAPPAEMLAPLLVQSLQNSGCLNAVVSPPFSGNASMVLDTRLLALQQEFKGRSSQVRLVLQMNLQNNTTREVLASPQFEVVVPAASDPYAGVVAANKAVAVVLAKIKTTVCRELTID